MKTTIIEILNKIANGEEPPAKILYCDDVYVYTGEDYYNRDNNECLFDDRYFFSILNDEVDILETTITYTPNELKWGGKIKKIGKCDEHDMTPYGELHNPTDNEIILMFKINEIIDRLNNE